MSVSLAERAVLDHCPQHDPFGAAMAAAAHHAGMHHAGMHHAGMHHAGMHHAADAHRSSGRPHRCSCLERCCGATAMLLPDGVVRVPEAAATYAVLPARAPQAAGPARSDTRLPFANGPPPALAA